MIFVVVGTQAPFERLVGAVDEWAAAHPAQPVLAQVGRSNTKYSNIETRRWMDSDEFTDAVRSARLIVAHAGIGTILTAARHEVPIVVMPRRARLGEHRDDHQVHTAQRLHDRGAVAVAWWESELPAVIDQVLDGTFRLVRQNSTRAALLGAVRQEVLSALGE